MTRPGAASISWAAEMIETTAIGDSAASYMPTGQEEETTEGDHEAVERLRCLLKERGRERERAGKDRAGRDALDRGRQSVTKTK